MISALVWFLITSIANILLASPWRPIILPCVSLQRKSFTSTFWRLHEKKIPVASWPLPKKVNFGPCIPLTKYWNFYLASLYANACSFHLKVILLGNFKCLCQDAIWAGWAVWANDAVLSIELVGPNDTFVLFEPVNYAKWDIRVIWVSWAKWDCCVNWAAWVKWDISIIWAS